MRVILNSLQAIDDRRIKSNAIKEKIMLSMRACQDFANAQFFLFILYINNFPFKYNVRVLSNGHIEVYS